MLNRLFRGRRGKRNSGQATPTGETYIAQLNEPKLRKQPAVRKGHSKSVGYEDDAPHSLMLGVDHLS